MDYFITWTSLIPAKKESSLGLTTQRYLQLRRYLWLSGCNTHFKDSIRHWHVNQEPKNRRGWTSKAGKTISYTYVNRLPNEFKLMRCSRAEQSWCLTCHRESGQAFYVCVSETVGLLWQTIEQSDGDELEGRGPSCRSTFHSAWRQSAHAATLTLWDNYTCCDTPAPPPRCCMHLEATTELSCYNTRITQSSTERISVNGAADTIISGSPESSHPFQHESFFSSCLCLCLHVSPAMTRFMHFKGFHDISERLFLCLEQCCVLCINLNKALLEGVRWLGGGGCRLGRVNCVATGTKYCFICTCMQSKKTKNGKNTTQEAILGGILLEIADDNAASCVYIVKEYAFKSTITQEGRYRRARKLKSKLWQGTARPTCNSQSADFSFNQSKLIRLKLGKGANYAR